MVLSGARRYNQAHNGTVRCIMVLSGA